MAVIGCTLGMEAWIETDDIGIRRGFKQKSCENGARRRPSDQDA